MLYKRVSIMPQLVATDFVPCHDTATIQISVDSISAISMTVTDSVIAKPPVLRLWVLLPILVTPGVTWYFGDGDSISNVNPILHSYDVSGTYTVSVTAHYRSLPRYSTSRSFTIFKAPSISLGGIHPLPRKRNIC